MLKFHWIVAALVSVLAWVGQASASLITPTGHAQLEGWLGEGPLSLTQIFSKTTGDGKTSWDFHAAVDGKGRTFTVMEVLAQNGYSYQIIGGYNPQSWSSIGNYNYSPLVSDRTAFLFNLTSSVIQQQGVGTQGIYQTYNRANYGPTFGGGHDLYVDYTLSLAYANQYSYGPNTYNGINIVGSRYNGLNIRIGTMEVYTISNFVAVPVPSGLALCGTFFVTLCTYRRLRRSKQSV